MSYISEYIEQLNKKNRKVLSIFLTAGFPDRNKFTDLAKNVLDAGADMIELGIPFSDPLADGQVIQASSKIALDKGVNIKDVLKYSEDISAYSNKPIILMCYANPVRKYGIKNFFNDAVNSGVRGLIVPDIPLEEYESFFSHSESRHCCDEESLTEEKEEALYSVGHYIDVILLTTPTSSNERIQKIDAKSNGFVYCVSVAGTTGIKNNFNSGTIENLRRTYSLLKKNKMLIGFGISKPEDVINFSPFCNGVIVGSRIMKSLLDGDKLDDTLKIISDLSDACDIAPNH